MSFDGTKVKIYSRTDIFGAKFVVLFLLEVPEPVEGPVYLKNKTYTYEIHSTDPYVVARCYAYCMQHDQETL